MAFARLARWLLPEICLHCKEDLPAAARLLCPPCRRMLPALGASYDPAEAAPPCRLIRAVFSYRGPVVSLVHAFKYRGRRSAARLAGSWMASTLALFPELGPIDALVPVPLHPRRQAERGYNQARLLADELSARWGLEVLDALTRSRATAQQWRLGKGDRSENLRDAFLAASCVKGRRLLIIDDVCTTGASLRECARALIKEGAADACGYVLARQG